MVGGPSHRIPALKLSGGTDQSSPCIIRRQESPSRTLRRRRQHHIVLEQVGINPHTRYGFKLLEPLSELYKDQVRSLAKYLAVPNEFSERQPFPGPGLLVRCIGEVKKSKLETLKRATSIVEDRLGAVGSNQYFAAIIENRFADQPSPKTLRKVAADALDPPQDEVRAEAFLDRVTAVKGDERAYARLASIALRNETREAFGWLHDKLNILQSSVVESFKDITRVAVLVKDRRVAWT